MSDFEDWYANMNGMLQCLRGVKYNIKELQIQTRSILRYYPMLKRNAPKYRHQEAYDDLLRVLSIIADDLEWGMKRAKRTRDERKVLKRKACLTVLLTKKRTACCSQKAEL